MLADAVSAAGNGLGQGQQVRVRCRSRSRCQGGRRNGTGSLYDIDII